MNEKDILCGGRKSSFRKAVARNHEFLERYARVVARKPMSVDRYFQLWTETCILSPDISTLWLELLSGLGYDRAIVDFENDAVFHAFVEPCDCGTIKNKRIGA